MFYRFCLHEYTKQNLTELNCFVVFYFNIVVSSFKLSLSDHPASGGDHLSEQHPARFRCLESNFPCLSHDKKFSVEQKTLMGRQWLMQPLSL
jgi:hypothetical protein